jgi:hypothetical protein
MRQSKIDTLLDAKSKKKTFQEFYRQTQDQVFETNLKYALSDSFSIDDLYSEIELNEGAVASAAAAGIMLRQSRKLKQMNFSKSENIGKGFAILAQLIVLSQIAGTVVLKKALSKTK